PARNLGRREVPDFGLHAWPTRARPIDFLLMLDFKPELGPCPELGSSREAMLSCRRHARSAPMLSTVLSS
ncbi:hypothetical protein Dimus_000444, partial [Dionaea muscipula]